MGRLCTRATAAIASMVVRLLTMVMVPAPVMISTTVAVWIRISDSDLLTMTMDLWREPASTRFSRPARVE